MKALHHRGHGGHRGKILSQTGLNLRVLSVLRGGEIVGVLAVIALLMTAAVWLQRVRERSFPLAASNDEALYLKSGGAARRLSVAYPTLASDVYWIRAIQYYGGTKRLIGTDQDAALGTSQTNVDASRRRYDLLYPLLDLTTTLDPRFHIAYR